MTGAFAAALLVTSGGLLLRYALAPARPPLAVELARLLGPAPAKSLNTIRERKLVTRLLEESERRGPRWDRIRVDLAVTDGSLDEHAVRSAGAGLALGLLVLLLGFGLRLEGLAVPLAFTAVAAVLAMVAGMALPTMLARQAATDRREQMHTSLPGYLDLVGVMLAAGESLDAALRHAAALADSWPYARLREALDRAAVSRRRAAEELTELGEALGVAELVELADALAVASSEGTAARVSLAARARGLRARQLAAAETAAGRATEGMSFPLVALVTGFVLLIGYPAMVGLSTGLGSR